MADIDAKTLHAIDTAIEALVLTKQGESEGIELDEEETPKAAKLVERARGGEDVSDAELNAVLENLKDRRAKLTGNRVPDALYDKSPRQRSE